MRIDSHQHFWRYDPKALPWIGAGMEVLRRDFLPADLTPELDAAGIDACIAVQAQHREAETEWLLQLAATTPRIVGVVGWVDLTAKDAATRLDRIAHPRLCGIRHIVQDEADDGFLRRPDFRAGLARLAERGLTYDLLVFPRHLPAARETVAARPDLSFVLDHIAKPALRDPGVDPTWERDIRHLAELPNVACKLSGLVTETDWQHAPRPADTTTAEVAAGYAARCAAHVAVVVESFGPERLLFGSDWPVCRLATGYAEVHRIAQELLRPHGLAADPGVFGGNAARWYRLGEAPR